MRAWELLLPLAVVAGVAAPVVVPRLMSPAEAGDCRVKGRVVDPDGKPVAGALIEVITHIDPNFGTVAVAKATTDAAGAFDVADRPAGPTWVEAGHSAFAPGSGELIHLDPARGPSDVRIVLRRGGRLVGSVRRRDGSPLRDAELLLLNPAEESRARRARTRVKRDGSFEMTQLRSGAGTLIATVGPGGPSQKRFGRTVEIVDEEVVTADLVLGEVVVSGRVTRSGAPGSGLRISVTNSRVDPIKAVAAQLLDGKERSIERGTTTDENGAFSLTADGPGAAFVQITTADRSVRFPSQDIELPDADEHVLELAVGGTRVEGTVTDEVTGRPMQGARARLQRSEAGSGGYAGTGRTDAEGRFQIEAPPGSYFLKTDQLEKGYGTTTMSLVLPEEGVDGVRVTLKPAPTIRGRVVDARGRAPLNPVIWACGSDGKMVPQRPAAENGRFLLQNLEQQTYNLFVRSPLDGALGFVGAVSPGPEEAVITLRPASTLTVRAFDGRGQPVAGAMIALHSIDGHAVFGAQNGATDEHGVGTLPVPAGAIGVALKGGNRGKLEGRAVTQVASGAEGDVTVTMATAADPPRRR